MSNNVDPHYAERVEEKMKHVVKGLRQLADEVEREIMRFQRFSAKNMSTNGELAARVIAIVTWGIPNLNLSILTQANADYDREVSKDGA